MENEAIVSQKNKKLGLVKVMVVVVSIILLIAVLSNPTTDIVDSQRSNEFEKVTQQPPKSNSFNQRYNLIEHEFVVSLVGAKQFCEFTMGFMTADDQRIVDNVYQHELVIRAAIIMEVSSLSSSQLQTLDDKQRLADNIKARMNQVLLEHGAAAGIEEVFFTQFIIQ
ncbi:MAG: flagellar basal body-associated FliL family protein [Gammaproteobacteria bacterium]|nr:flagellar basal body-associated FliL family protein [Gammaproteobacteria bacterium]